ncbi:MAG: hypothetical protein HYX63_06685 [Gammaproteobacteria bacterium]|nr:hypothetical protein [Gammaproteobacteria bacterium]
MLSRTHHCDPQFHEVTKRVPVHLFARDAAQRWGDALREEAASFGEVCSVMRQLAFGGGRGVITQPLASLAYRLVYRHWGQYSADSDWFAEQSDGLLSPAQCAFLQRQYSWTHASPYTGGCSTISLWDHVAQEMVCFRSLDWPAAEAIGRTTRIFDLRGPRGETHGSSAGMMGMLGILTGVREGVSVVLNFAPSPGLAGRCKPDPTLMLRRFFEDLSVHDFSDAVELLSRERPGAPCFITVCGVNRGEACVLGWDVAGPPEIRWADKAGVLVQTNHYHNASSAVGRNKPQLRSAPPGGWFHTKLQRNSQQRAQFLLSELRKLISAQEPITSEALCKLYSQPPVWNHETAHWVEMRPKHNQLRAWVHRADLAA